MTDKPEPQFSLWPIINDLPLDRPSLESQPTSLADEVIRSWQTLEDSTRRLYVAEQKYGYAMIFYSGTDRELVTAKAVEMAKERKKIDFEKCMLARKAYLAEKIKRDPKLRDRIAEAYQLDQSEIGIALSFSESMAELWPNNRRMR